MRVLNYTVRIHAAEEGGFWAEVPALPGCFTQGKTLDEVRTMAKEAIEGYLTVLTQRGKQVPIEEKDLVGTFDVQVKVPAVA